MESNPIIRDLIYFDFDKAASIYSQVEGGLIQQIQSGTEANKDDHNIRKYDFKLFNAEFGGIGAEKSSELISKVLHHDLLVRIEEALFQQGFAVDINNEIDNNSASVEIIRSKFSNKAYIRAEGWAVIEDYVRLKRIADNFNNITEYIKKCTISSNSELADKIREIKENQKLSKKRREELLKDIDNLTGLGSVPEWHINGMKLFIDTFMPCRINFRVYPFESVPDFQVIANLKRDSFVDTDLENIIFAHNTQPNIKLTIFGLITSIPNKPQETIFDPLSEFDIQTDYDSDQKSFEKAFRNMFGAMGEFDKFVRYSRYPNITVYPIAVYRMIQGYKEI